ncbi:MAG: cytochrome c oxidase subunit II, partial [Gemmatimonadaceae bacterium]
MVGTFRPRRLASAVLLGALALGLAACGGEYPNSTFNHNTDFNASTDALWDKLLLWGTVVFIGVEAALVYTIFRFRRRPGAPKPKQVHGNTALEITWTAIPAVILIFIAIPTVRTIFKTQAKAAPESLQVEVIGHQWWWEFRYPQYGITTANELYLPNGRTVNFQLKTVDVLHSFWIPQMGGKRDLISNTTTYLWVTPNKDLPSSAWNGFCAEFCGPSHANMKFRV